MVRDWPNRTAFGTGDEDASHSQHCVGRLALVVAITGNPCFRGRGGCGTPFPKEPEESSAILYSRRQMRCEAAVCEDA
jgi:hypothetical protein